MRSNSISSASSNISRARLRTTRRASGPFWKNAHHALKADSSLGWESDPTLKRSMAHVVIVGAGHAGGTLAALLRQYGHSGLITLIGDEPIPPYQRPPLSKAWLKGEAAVESLTL